MKITISKDLPIMEMPGDNHFTEMCEARLLNYDQAIHERPEPRNCEEWAKKDGLTMDALCAACNFCALAREYEEDRLAAGKDGRPSKRSSVAKKIF